MTKFTVVYDNRSKNPDLIPDWGFACLVETDKEKILFDTGARADILAQNMVGLGLSIPKKVFISHNHWDHTDGLGAISSPYSCWLAASAMQILGKKVNEVGGTPIACSEPIEFLPHIWSTGEMKNTEEIEKSEHGLVIETKHGLVLLTGCAHPGIVNMVERVVQVFKQPPYYVIGGFHLYESSADEIMHVSDQLQTLGVTNIGPCHCTGESALHHLKKGWGKRFTDIKVGWAKKI